MPPKKDDSYRKNRENYKKNLTGNSNDSMGQAEEEDFGETIQGRLVYSDLYVIGREKKSSVGKGGRSPHSDAPGGSGGSLRSPRILSSREFIEEYRKNNPGDSNPPEQKPALKPDKSKATKREKIQAENATSANAKAANTKAESKGARKGKNVGSEPGQRGKAVGLRVIGGRLRAVRLEYSGDHRVRPMKDRIRESVFNLIGTQVTGKHVIDLFAGTGALAFEALSRGAVSATLIEIHFPTARVTRHNIAALDAKEPGIAQKIDLLTTDVFFWGRSLTETERDTPRSRSQTSDRRPLPTEIPWLVFCSPPYDFYVERETEMLTLLETLRSAAPSGSLFVVEADERFDFDRLGVAIPPKKRKSYPPAEVAIFSSDEVDNAAGGT